MLVVGVVGTTWICVLSNGFDSIFLIVIITTQLSIITISDNSIGIGLSIFLNFKSCDYYSMIL
jgi:hypothetical protein